MNPLMTRNQKLSDQSEMFMTSSISEKKIGFIFVFYLFLCTVNL